MKKLKTKNIYKASNVIFDADKIEAYSYDHWCFVKVIKGKIVFNDFNYSHTTSRHQHKVRNLMKDLGIEIDYFVDIRDSLSETRVIETALYPLYDKYIKNLFYMNKLRVRESTKEKLRNDNKTIKLHIKKLRELGCQYNWSQIHHHYRMHMKESRKAKAFKVFIKQNKHKSFKYFNKVFKIVSKSIDYPYFEIISTQGITKTIHWESFTKDAKELKLATTLNNL